MKHEFHEDKSSHVSGLDYDPTTKIVSAHFKNGRSYSHLNVPQEAIYNWIRYHSPGAFYHSVIKRYKLVG